MRGLAIGVLLAACGGSGSGGDDGGGGGPLTQDELTTGCVLFAACDGGDGINDCFTDIAPILQPDVFRCIIAAGSDCVASRACIGMTLEASPTCTPGSHCEGNTVVDCGDGVQVTFECGSPFTTGPNCIVNGAGRADCGAATCTTESQACDGTHAQLCDLGANILEDVDCASVDMDCISGTCTSPGGGGACVDGTPPGCAGPAIERCNNGVTALLDCPSRIAGSNCVAITAPFADAYCGFGTACQPDKGTETCTGNTVNFCAAGVAGAVDCTTLGFTQCLNGTCLSL